MFDTSKEQILARFPFDTPREGQIETIQFALDSFNAGKKFVVIEAPCGAGKSVIGVTIAQFFQRSFYLTIQKFLQDQLITEFGEKGKVQNMLVDLKGRNAYECPYYRTYAEELRKKKIITLQQYYQFVEEKFDCSEGYCRRKGNYQLPECIQNNFCPYYNQLHKAIESRICLMNFAGFLSHTNFTGKFERRNLMIIDEAHNVETQLLNFISVTLNEKDLEGVTFPRLDTPEEYARWFASSKVELALDHKINMANNANDHKTADEFTALKEKISWFIIEMTQPDHDIWVSEYQQGDRGAKLVFKPIYVRKQARKYLFGMADYVLMMSATILNVNVMARSLGIEKGEIAARRMASRFPKENRPIYYKPSVKVTGGKGQQPVWGPPLLKAVQQIMRKYPDKKGIIHTHNFAIAQMIVDESDPDVGGRLLFQKNFPNKAEMLDVHRASTNTVIIAPAMHEGLDLVDDLSRFQIICKVPFANFYEDKQLAARKEDDPQFYDWLTALKLVQSVGRSVRSEKDWAHTYIIDETFGWWYRDNQNMLPTWFKEAVII